MSATVKISRRTAEALLGIADEYTHFRREWEELGRALLPSKPRKPDTRKAAKRATKKEQTSAIRAEVFKRAENVCELCRDDTAMDLHHAFGRVRVKQSVSNTIALCRPCHWALTENRPNAAYWWERVRAHFIRHGFWGEAQLAGKKLDLAESKSGAISNT